MNIMRFGLMRTAVFTALLVAGFLLHAGQAEAAPDSAQLATSVRVQAAQAKSAIKGELAAALKREVSARAAQTTASARLGGVAEALQAAATAAPAQGLLLTPTATAYGASPL